jgi:flagellar motor protein MotB
MIGNNKDEYEDAGSQEGENYFVSLTDLMTGVVFIFVILLVTYALTFNAAKSDLEKVRDIAEASRIEAEKAEAQAKEEKETAAKTRIDLEAKVRSSKEQAEKIDSLARLLKEREEQRQKNLEDIVGRMQLKDIKVSLDSENGIIRLPEALLFDSGQSIVRPEGKLALEVVAEEITQLVERWSAPNSDFRLEALFIEGHTDSNPIRTAKFADNWELSTSRAVSISRALTLAQPDLLNFKNPNGLPVLGVSGYGENRPVADNTSDDGRRKNRRIDLRFILAYPSKEQVSKITGGDRSP